jgi:uracil-DNA glycosylase family 4
VTQPNRQRALAQLRTEIVNCERCPRLVRYRRAVAQEKRRAFSDWTYWGKPVPGFGPANARLLIVGLAPAAHGGNRTGRVFTGDRSGDFLYAALHRAGFANQPTSNHCDDGLTLIDAYVNAAVRCAPPENKPEREETRNCQRFLLREMELLPTRVVIALGKFAFDAYLDARGALALPVPKPRPRFGHAVACDLSDVILIGSYHPSQRNTQTGFLTPSMFDAVFKQAKRLLDRADPR